MSMNVPRPNFFANQTKMAVGPSSAYSSRPEADAASIYFASSASSTYSEKPLVSSKEHTSKRSKAWQKTKKLLAAIPEPAREQKPAVVGPETEEEMLKRLRKFGELDYGTYQGGPFSGHPWGR